MSSTDKPAVAVGIDPGWDNLGLAALDSQGELLFSSTIDCSLHGTSYKAIPKILELLEPYSVATAGIERYVTYGQGTPVKEAEHIQHMIGGLSFAFHLGGAHVMLLRAIDWKPELCKYLHQEQNFRNPSTRFDKKFSIASAVAITGVKPKTDHEADAIGIGYLTSVLVRQYARKKLVESLQQQPKP
jgi:hypothetical protein